MPQVVARFTVTDGLKAMLNGVLSAAGGTVERFEIGRSPRVIRKDAEGLLLDGYGIVYPLTSPLVWGSLGRPEDSLTAAYQITIVGRNDEHAQRLADATRAAITGRTGSAFTNPISATDMTVIDRRCREQGTLEQGTGDLWQVPDVYDLEVQANA